MTQEKRIENIHKAPDEALVDTLDWLVTVRATHKAETFELTWWELAELIKETKTEIINRMNAHTKEL